MSTRFSLLPSELIGELALLLTTDVLSVVCSLPEFDRMSQRVWSRLYYRDLSVHPPSTDIKNAYFSGMTVVGEHYRVDLNGRIWFTECEQVHASVYVHKLVRAGYDVHFGKLSYYYMNLAWPLLTEMATKGQLTLIKHMMPFLLSHRCALDPATESAVKAGHLDVVKYLIQHERRNPYTYQLFLLTVESGHIDVLEYLLTSSKQALTQDVYNRIMVSAIRIGNFQVIDCWMHHRPSHLTFDANLHLYNAAMMGRWQLLDEFHQRGGHILRPFLVGTFCSKPKVHDWMQKHISPEVYAADARYVSTYDIGTAKMNFRALPSILEDGFFSAILKTLVVDCPNFKLARIISKHPAMTRGVIEGVLTEICDDPRAKMSDVEEVVSYLKTRL